MEDMKHEIVESNPDIDVRFYLSVDEGSYVPPHWHDSIEIVCVLEGHIVVHFEGQKHEIRENEFIIVNSRVVHSVLSGRNQAIVLQIPLTVFQKYVPDIGNYVFTVDMHPKRETDATRLETIRKIFADMYIIYDIRPEGYLLKFNSLLYDLLYMLVHSYSVRNPVKNQQREGQNLQHLSEIMSYLKEHYREKILLPDLAAHFGYNEDYLSRFFKKYTGMTILEYLYAYRATRICQDLVNTDNSITDIVLKHGGTNRRVMLRSFHELYGCTPKQKRSQMRAAAAAGKETVTEDEDSG